MTTPKPLRLVVAINPSASFGRGRDVGPAVVQTLRAAGHEVTALTEPDFDELVDAARSALKRHPDALVVVGGDGMVSLGVNLLAGTKIPLGIVPSGTGNDMARGLGIPVGNTEAAIELLLSLLRQPPRVIDAGRVTEADGRTTWFASVLSAGFDAVVNERANLMRWPRGRSRYNLALLRELAVLKPIRYRLTLDGVVSETRAMLVAAGNNVSLGGGMRLVPNAELDDGLLDVLVVQPLSRTAFLRIFPRVFKGTHVSDPRVTITHARSIRIEADAVVAYADGERVGPLPIDIELVPAALRVLAPTPG
ncbi:diacylglycerol kinase [Parafrigoribacterium soli]|uniref:diacylglycerol kinase n=1 Tax=Parafrigoribacterium soli TaxID=3144663 RepID=UPI0032EE780B